MADVFLLEVVTVCLSVQAVWDSCFQAALKEGRNNSRVVCMEQVRLSKTLIDIFVMKGREEFFYDAGNNMGQGHVLMPW